MSKNQKHSLLRHPDIYTFSVVAWSKIQKVCISDLIIAPLMQLYGFLLFFLNCHVKTCHWSKFQAKIFIFGDFRFFTLFMYPKFDKLTRFTIFTKFGRKWPKMHGKMLQNVVIPLFCHFRHKSSFKSDYDWQS